MVLGPETSNFGTRDLTKKGVCVYIYIMCICVCIYIYNTFILYVYLGYFDTGDTQQHEAWTTQWTQLEPRRETGSRFCLAVILKRGVRAPLKRGLGLL